MSHNVEAISLVVNHLVVLGRVTGSDELTEVSVGGLPSPAVVPVVGYCGFEVAQPRRRHAPNPESCGFVFACPLDFDLAREIASVPGPLTVELRSRGRAVGEAIMNVCSLLEARMQNAGEALELLCGGMAEANPSFARIVLSIAKDEHTTPRITSHLDRHVVAPGIGFVATGWTENLSEHAVVFLLDEFRLAVHPEQIFLNLRADVARDIVNRGGNADSALHGFTLIDAVAGDRHELRLASLSGLQVHWSPALDLNRMGSVRSLLQMLAAQVPASDIQRRSASSQVLQRFLTGFTKPQATATLVDYKTAGNVPDLSIIIPFYRDDFFLVDHLESQRRTDLDAEWIFVSDDPSLNTSMARTCQARRASLMKTTRLLSLSENLGFARANNLAFRHAAADYVLFMNSDIYWRSFAPIEYGLEILRNDATVGIVGFVLRFEDETLQHAGMRFRVTPELDNLLLLVHDGKGLPAKEYGSVISSRDVDAVTGALMLVRRSDFDDTVFDEGYVGSDFEDGDLCLQMQARGKRVVLVECDGLYHLERQSIGSTDAHRLLTYVNGARFTTKWRTDASPLVPLLDQSAGAAYIESPALRVDLVAVEHVPAPVLARCAIHLHLFYPDLLAEMFSYLNRPYMQPFDIYITVTDQQTLARVAAEIEKSGRANIAVDKVTNAGRDLAPLFVHHRELFSRYKYVCHIHTKKSPHTDFGDDWRRYLIDACIGSEARIRSIIAYLEKHPGTGVAFPEPYFRIAPFLGQEVNLEKINLVLRRMNTNWNYQSIVYPAGSMCWLRSEAFREVLDRLPPLSEFEQEEDQIDGTLAHALERCLTLVPKLSGYASLCYSHKRGARRLARSA